MPRSDTSFSKCFVRDFLIAVVILFIIGLAPAIYFASQAKRDVSESFIENSTERAANEFRNVGSSTQNSVRMARQWGTSGLLTLNDPESMNHLLFPIVQQDDHHFGLIIADTASSRISVIALCVSIGWADHKFSGAGTLHPYIHKPAS